MARLRYNGLTTTLGGTGLDATQTSITFSAALTSAAGAVPTISGSDTIALSILDSAGNVSEIVSLTAYTSGATTGTIVRGQESTTASAHAAGVAVVHSPTAADFTASSGNGRTLISETVLSADTASITFSSIPATYRHLELVLRGRGGNATAYEELRVSINGDTTSANYDARYLINQANSTFSGAASARSIAYITGNSPAAGLMGQVAIFIPNYARTDFQKTLRTEFHEPGNPILGQMGGLWKSTAAVTSIAITPATSGMFKTGTIAQLYGLV